MTRQTGIMKYFTIILCALCSVTIQAQPDSVKVSEYFSTICKDENRLQQFFAAMPKGGDLHNHLSGAVYAENYFKYAAEDRLWVDRSTGKLYLPQDSAKGRDMIRLSPDMPDLHNTRMMLIDKWSVRNFNPGKFPLGADEYFFGTFGLFNVVAGRHTVELMRELRERAASENVQYLEILLSSPGINAARLDALCGEGFYARHNARLRTAISEDAQRAKDSENTDRLLADIFHEWEHSPAMADWVSRYVAYIDSIDTHSEPSRTLPSDYDGRPVCRYQGFASRNAEPLVVYAQLYVAFKSCLFKGSKLVGVNIVSAENSEIAMADCTAHMKMFRCLDKMTGGKVHTSIHAGELTLGLVMPEEMGNHIREAVLIAGADRIGHGVDIAFERESLSLLDTMRKRQVAVEVNLTSNEFILGVRDDAHPFMLYRQEGVPMVLSTDDAGILRTNLTRQYVLAVLRYGLDYYEIKQLVRNSIRFGFMSEATKRMLLQRVEKEFAAFEKQWRKHMRSRG